MKRIRDSIYIFGFVVGLLATLSCGSVLAATAPTGPKTPQEINDWLRLGYTTAIAMDANHTYDGNSIYSRLSCAETISKYYSTWKGSKLYNDGNGNGLSPTGKSASYRYDTWISQAGIGNASIPMTFTYTNIMNSDGTVNPVALQINSLSFVCRPFAKPVPTNSCGLTGAQWVAKSGWIDSLGDVDNGVHDGGTRNYSSSGSESCFINLKEWQHIQIQNLSVKSIKSSDGAVLNKGTVDQPASNKLELDKDSSSRYWLADPLPFNYNPDSASVQYAATNHTTLTVTVTMTYKQQNKYENDVIYCEDGTSDGLFETHKTGEIKWSKCENDTTDLTFAIMFGNVPNPSTNELICREGKFLSDMTVGRPQTLSDAGASFTESWPAGVTVSGVTVTGPSNPVSFTLPLAPGYDRDGTDDSLTVREIVFNPTVAGNYTVSYTVGGNGVSSKTCSSTGTVGTKPYFEVNGGDIISGKAESGAEQVGEGSNADVITWNADNSPSYDGGNTNLAVIATGSISGLVTGKGNASLPALSFASDRQSDYGGRFASLAAKPVYRSKVSTASTTVLGGNFVLNVNTPSGTYTSDHDLTVSGTVGSDKSISLLVSAGHNVFVSGVAYAPYTLATVPRFTVYTSADDTGAGGNIVVSSDVTALHGNYIAGGNFYSCGAGATTPYDFSDPVTAVNAAAIAACNNQLTLYGTVSANKVVLGRTSGSYVTPAVGGAEIFKYGPEVWLGAPADKKTFDNYVSLPPIL